MLDLQVPKMNSEDFSSLQKLLKLCQGGREKQGQKLLPPVTSEWFVLTYFLGKSFFDVMLDGYSFGT